MNNGRLAEMPPDMFGWGRTFTGSCGQEAWSLINPPPLYSSQSLVPPVADSGWYLQIVNYSAMCALSLLLSGSLLIPPGIVNNPHWQHNTCFVLSSKTPRRGIKIYYGLHRYCAAAKSLLRCILTLQNSHTSHKFWYGKYCINYTYTCVIK